MMRSGRWRALPVLAVTTGFVLATATAAVAAGAVHQFSDVHLFEDMSVAGDASLVRTGSTVRLNLHTDTHGGLFEFGVPTGPDWEVGDATTVWFVVFNEPGACVGGCGEDEVVDAFLGGANLAGVGLHYGTGHVAGHHFGASASLREWDVGGRLFGMPLKDAQTAEVHVIVRSHGPAATLSGGDLAEALHSVDGGCGTNTCGDAQFAVFLAP